MQRILRALAVICALAGAALHAQDFKKQVIYQIGTKMLAEIPSITEVNLEANNRTWDTIQEQGDSVGVYTDARPPYGCLGLSLRR